MGKGTATASTPTVCENPTAIKTAIDALTLASANAGTSAGDNYDSIEVVPINNGQYLVFKIAYAAS